MSAVEEVLLNQIRLAGLPEPEREYRFRSERRWRFDFAWPDSNAPIRNVAVEVEGGVYAGGRHTRGEGFTADCHKYNTAVLWGWRVLRVTADMVYSGEALQLIEKALGRGTQGEQQ